MASAVAFEMESKKLNSQTKSGIPLLTEGVETSPSRLNIGWPVEAPKSPPPEKAPSVAGAPKLELKRGPLQAAERLVRDNVADKLSDDQYLARLHSLIGRYTKYELYQRLYPRNTVPFVLRIHDIGFKPTLERDMGNTGEGAWYQTDDGYGARVQINGTCPSGKDCPDTKAFFDAITNKLQLPTEAPGLSPRTGTNLINVVGVPVEYNDHTDMLCVSADKQVWRYEPFVPGGNTRQRNIDSGLYGFFNANLPSFKYNFHRLDERQCVGAIRDWDRIHSENSLAQDYSMLYFIRRMKGMTHEEAAINLVAIGDDIVPEMVNLMYSLAMKYRQLHP